MFVDIFNTNEKYEIIYADPPWEYKQAGSKKSVRGMAKQHYNTMSIEEICNLPIRQIKTDSSLLFLWATFPNIDAAIKVIEQWGFMYKTAAFVWIKKNAKTNSNFCGMGAYTRANAEVCLLASSKKTKASKVVKKHNVRQIVEAPRGKHSEKPNVVRERILDLLGELPRIELFSRGHIDGWHYWGNDYEEYFRKEIIL